MTGDGVGTGHTKATGQFGRAHPSGQLEQRQWVPAGLRHDPVTNLLVQMARNGRPEQRPGVLIDQPPECQRWQGRKQSLIVRLSDREEEKDSFRQ